MSSKLRVGVAGPVGSGKTALVETLCLSLKKNYEIAVVTNDIYTKEDANFLINKIDVLLDDRNDRAGVKFKAAELIGIPFQIIVGRDSVNKEVELLSRTNNTKFKISTDKLLETFISESEIMYNKKS